MGWNKGSQSSGTISVLRDFPIVILGFLLNTVRSVCRGAVDTNFCLSVACLDIPFDRDIERRGAHGNGSAA